MPKEEWGVKRVCPTTGKRFYDLNKDPVVSPYTGELVELHSGKTRSIAADPEDAETKKMKASEEEETILEEEEDVDMDVDLGDDVLDEDDDDDNVSLDDIADVAQEDDDS
ncbi:MAG: TIGR02300 family protein [Pseudomonadota bacterium]